jgi:eukaryotic-like serine/threonine-protein kinase
MATAGLNRMMLWGDFEGRKLEERWLLGHLVRPEGRRAWFEAIGPDGVPVMLSITEALNDEDELLERLQAAAEIRHPNVVALGEAVISHLDDVPVVVATMEMTDENLGDVLRERLLSAAEGRQVLDAVLAALGMMHAHGLVHKHIDAASVVAMGETIKLRSDCVQMAGSAFGTAAAEDVRAAARMATYAVTGKYPAGENDPVLQLLPESMARAVRRALSGMAAATEVAALAGTRLELARDAKRIEPLSKKAMKAGTADVVVSREKMAEPSVAPKVEPESATEKKPAAMMAGSSAPRLVALRSTEVHAQGALFGDAFMLPGEREAAANLDEPEVSRWPRAPYVIAAAIAVVLVTVFTLYGLLRSEPEQQKPATPATNAMIVTSLSNFC